MNDNLENQAKLSACLTATELVSLRKNSNNHDEFPYIIGQKCYSRSDTWLEEKAVEYVLENQNETLNQKVASRISDLIEAEWNADLNVAVTSKLKGKYVQHMGHMVEKKIHLSPEESVFLLQNRSIEILHKKASVSLEEAYAVILKKSLSFEKYQVYSHLAQLGFIVVQHQPKLHSLRKGNLSKSKKRKHKRNDTISLEEEPKEKKSTLSSVLCKDADISNSSEPCLTQENSAVSNDSQNVKNTEILVEISESNESTALNISNEQSTLLSSTVQFTCDEEKNHSNVNSFQNNTCESITLSLSDKPENVSDTLNSQKLNDNAQKEISSEPNNSMDLRNSDECEHVKEPETLVSFKSFASFEYSQPTFENKNSNVTNAAVENTVSNDCTILTAANTDVGEERSDLTLSEHFKPLVSNSGRSNSVKLSDISSDLEKVKKKYVPEPDNYVVEVNDKSRDEPSSDEDSIEVANNSESDRECDVMSCSSEDENFVDVYGGLSDTFSVREELGDDDITLVEVKKKETTPLAIIDILSDEEQTERMSIGDSSDNDDEIQIVKVCAGSSKNPTLGRNSYQTVNSIKKEQKYNIKGNHHKFMSSRPRVVFPELFKKDVVCLSRPQPNLLPNNVKPAKEAYVLNIKKKPSHSEKPSSRRLWNSYKDLQDYQRVRHRNRNADSGNWMFPRQENRQHHDSWNDAGHRFQNNFHESQSLPEMLPTIPGREFPGSHQRSNFNLGPLNMVPGMTGNIMVDLHRAAYSFANNMLSNMMNQSMMNNMPQFHSFQSSRYRGNYSNLESSLSNTQSSTLSYDSYLNNVKPPGPIDYGPSSSQRNEFQSPFNPLVNSVPTYPMGRDSPQNYNRNRDFLPRNFAHRGRPFPCVYGNVYNKKSWTDVKAIVERPKDVNDHNSDVEEVPIDINKVLWNSELHPLVKPGTNHLIEDVLKSLQKTKLDSLFHDTNDRYLPSANQFLQISFDVYLPGSNFKKTCPDIPKYRIAVVRATDPIPKFAEIVVLQKKWNDGAILQLAVVDNGDISFYSFNSIQLPRLIPHDV
ncbi:uncharacterized protein LOC129234584 [Uloborus diversus]|uniref:uncharacterized protein LOC129234584 n=1 Tax=Uloborus diversus TaxID=327109 RepID=UPI002409018F|nr:uncharacterized protein LOC129234584 [Uloborus diversus]